MVAPEEKVIMQSPDPAPPDQDPPPIASTLGPCQAKLVEQAGIETAGDLLPMPDGSHTKLYRVELSEREMQCIANGLAAFFNVVRLQKMMVNPMQTEALLTSLGKFKAALALGEIRVVTGIPNFEGMTK